MSLVTSTATPDFRSPDVESSASPVPLVTTAVAPINQRRMLDRDTTHKILRFCLTGGFVFGVDMTMLWLWSRFTPVRVAATAAYLIAVTVHFCLNKWWVFRSRSETNETQLFKYVLTVAACYLCMITSFSMALRFLTANIFIAKLIALPPTTALGFLMMKLFVFGERPQP